VIPLLLAVVGLAALILAVIGVSYTGHHIKAGLLPSGWRRARRILWVAGIVLGCFGACCSFYPYGGGRAFGLPFFSAYFDEAGRDYVGPLSMPALIANGIFWFFVPQLVLAFLAWCRLRRVQHP
jgi:hypothetical protein